MPPRPRSDCTRKRPTVLPTSVTVEAPRLWSLTPSIVRGTGILLAAALTPAGRGVGCAAGGCARPAGGCWRIRGPPLRGSLALGGMQAEGARSLGRAHGTSFTAKARRSAVREPPLRLPPDPPGNRLLEWLWGDLLALYRGFRSWRSVPSRAATPLL